MSLLINARKRPASDLIRLVETGGLSFRGGQKHYLYRAVDQHGQVIDILLRNKRDRASAEAFFRRVLNRTRVPPHMVVSDHHQPYIEAVADTAL